MTSHLLGYIRWSMLRSEILLNNRATCRSNFLASRIPLKLSETNIQKKNIHILWGLILNYYCYSFQVSKAPKYGIFMRRKQTPLRLKKDLISTNRITFSLFQQMLLHYHGGRSDKKQQEKQPCMCISEIPTHWSIVRFWALLCAYCLLLIRLGKNTCIYKMPN